MKTLLDFLNDRKDVVQNEQLLEIKICQEIFLAKAIDVGADKNFTIKGGVALYELTQGSRGFTKDIDLDLVSYSISDSSIYRLIETVNTSSLYPNITLEVVGKPKALHHANYQGKSMDVHFKDTEGNVFALSFDFGVHIPSLSSPLEQGFCTHLGNQERKLIFMIDPPEQMIAEKLSGFVKFGTRSTRTKDIFDIYWLLKNTQINLSLLGVLFEEIVVSRNRLQDTNEAVRRLIILFQLPVFMTKAKSIKNWLDADISTILQVIVTFLESLPQKTTKSV